jgi:hypothetical protein
MINYTLSLGLDPHTGGFVLSVTNGSGRCKLPDCERSERSGFLHDYHRNLDNDGLHQQHLAI